MDTQYFNTPNASRQISPGSPTSATTAPAVKLLTDLLQVLYPPDSVSLDVITVDDIKRRYWLTGLGAPALAAMEQAQRIVRARGDYSQVGLVEFNIGLIYLNWGDCRAAASQFAAARPPWSLASDTAATCLAHYAQGVALFHAFHNEPAMVQFSRAERCLNRSPLAGGSERFAALAQRMREPLQTAQAVLREHMWPADRMRDEANDWYVSVPTSAPTNVPTPASREAEAPAAATSRPAPPGWEAQPGAAPPEPPRAGTGTSEVRAAFQRAAVDEQRPQARGVPQPLTNLSRQPAEAPRGPVPGHMPVDDRFAWYVISESSGAFLKDLPVGSWVLVDRELENRPPIALQYVVVGSKQPGLGVVQVEPVFQAGVFAYCYLGYRTPRNELLPQPAGQLFLAEDEPLTTGDVQVLGVVEGFWNRIDGRNPGAG